MRPGTKDGGSGQILPMVALLMVVIIGMAALAIDGSNLYSQHRKMQADLDVAIRVAGAKMYNYSPADSVFTSTATAAITTAAMLLAEDGYPNAIYTNPASTVQPIGGSYLNGFCGTDTTAGGVGIVICDPPNAGFYQGSRNFNYVSGTLTQNIGGFFGQVIGLGKMRVSVRATAKTGGSGPPYAIIGLTPADCSILIQGASGVRLTVNGSIMANGDSCVKNGNGTVTGTSDQYNVTPGNKGTQIPANNPMNTRTGIQPVVDPFAAPPFTASVAGAPLTFTSACLNAGTCTTPVPPTCVAEFNNDISNSLTAAGVLSSGVTLPPNETYYFPPLTPTVGLSYSVGKFTNFSATSGTYNLLPQCDSSATGLPGVYYYTNTNKDDMQLSSGPSINSFNTTLIFDWNVGSGKYLVKDTGSSTIWELRAPTSGPWQGIAVTEPRAGSDPGPCIPSAPLEFAGNAGSFVDGVMDLPCTDVTVIGNSSNNLINGAIVGWSVTIAGSGNQIVNYDPTGVPANKGSVLVE